MKGHARWQYEKVREEGEVAAARKRSTRSWEKKCEEAAAREGIRIRRDVAPCAEKCNVKQVTPPDAPFNLRPKPGDVWKPLGVVICTVIDMYRESWKRCAIKELMVQRRLMCGKKVTTGERIRR